MTRLPISRRRLIIEWHPSPAIEIEFTTPPDPQLHQRRLDQGLRQVQQVAQAEAVIYEAANLLYEHWLASLETAAPDTPSADPQER